MGSLKIVMRALLRKGGRCAVASAAVPAGMVGVLPTTMTNDEDETVTITYRAGEIPAADLAEKPLGQPSAEPLTGEITTRSQVFFTSADDKIVSGTWECEPGASRWEFTTRGEIIHVLSGRMTVARDGEEGVELTPGSSAVFELGWQGTWTVHETLRKVFVVYRP